MTETLGLGEAVQAGDWTLVPVIRKISFSAPATSIFSVIPVGIIGIQEETVCFFPLLEGISWNGVEKELPGITGENRN